MARGATGTTRHTIGVTRVAVVFLLSRNDGWQINFRQFGALCWCRLFCWLSGSGFSNYCGSCYFGFNRRAVSETHFLSQLTLFTASLRLTYALFLLGILHRLFSLVQLFNFLLSLTLVIVTTAVAFATRSLLLIARFRFVCNVSSLLAVIASFRILLLCLTTVTAVILTVFAVF